MTDAPNPPLFITARFRTGSTMLWNIFRQIPEVVAFYEPLHGQLPAYISYPSTVREEHLFVKSYFDEYKQAQGALAIHSSDFADHRLFLEANDSYPELRDYIQALLDSVPSGKTCVIKFNRIDYRLPWIKKNFPQARLLHLTRNPHSQWYSTTSKYPGDVNKDIDMDDFYLATFARDLFRQFPFLAGKHTEHPYQRFYYLWKLSQLAGQRQSDVSYAYEDFLNAPDVYLKKMLEFAYLDRGDNFDRCLKFIESRPKRSWKQDRDDSWFEPYEIKCERLLDELGLNHGFALKPLQEIQVNSPAYQKLLDDPDNAEWALFSLKRAYAKEVNLKMKYHSELTIHDCPYKRELDDLKRSDSWRITAPMRSLFTWLRKIRG